MPYAQEEDDPFCPACKTRNLERHPSMRQRIWLLGLISALLGQLAHAHSTETILSVQVTNYTGYIIDADANSSAAGTIRDVIGVRAQIFFEEDSLNSSAWQYELAFRLVDR